MVSHNDFIVKWSSNIDGVLFEGHPDDTYNTNYLGLLSKGIHTVKLETYLNNFPETAKSDSLVISNIMNLEAVGQDNNIKLNWDKYEGSDFVSYKIYRDNFQPIAEIFDVNQTEYIDNSIANVARKYPYQVVVNTSAPLTFLYGSTIAKCSAHPALEMPYYVTKTIYDASRNRIYALLSKGISGGGTVFGIAILNPETMQIENNILTTEVFNDGSISADSNIMYLTQKYVDKITVVNLNTFSTSYINIDTNGWGLHKVEDTNTNYLICHRQPPTSGSSQMYLIDKNTGIATAFMEHLHGDIAYNSINNKVYLAQSNSTGSFILTANFNGSTLAYDNVQFPVNWQDGIDLPSPFVLLSTDKNSVFWDKYQLNANLQLIREFPVRMLDCSPANLYLAGLSKVYDYNGVNEILDYGNLGSIDKENVNFTDDHTVIITMSIDDHIVNYPETTYFLKYTLP